jgi:RimJ/RimL family protein N-acetyltransferase
VQKVIIEMDILNSASVRLAESLGATRVDFKPKAETIRGRWSDVYVYELVRNKPQ